MNAKAWRLYGASDLRLEDVGLEPAGDDGVYLAAEETDTCFARLRFNWDW